MTTMPLSSRRAGFGGHPTFATGGLVGRPPRLTASRRMRSMSWWSAAVLRARARLACSGGRGDASPSSMPAPRATPPATHTYGYLFRDGMPPADLLAAGRAEVTRYGARLLADRVVGVEPAYVIHMRGINVGSRNRVPMPGLRRCLEELGVSRCLNQYCQW
jgi:hypothetical protein